MVKYISIFVIVSISLLSTQCRFPQKNEISHIIFSNVQEGRKAITQDEQEHFFEKMNLKDIQLQMPQDSFVNLATAKKEYKKHLQAAVIEFSPKDKERLSKIMQNIEKWIDKIHPNLMPPFIRLIKIRPNHYGASVYYTRENAIIIPENVLIHFNEEVLTKVMIHEIFHIYSRYAKKQKRKELYGLIHHKKAEKEVTIPPSLANNILLNPDGLAENWYIEAQVKGETKKLVSFLVAKDNADVSRPFFTQLEHRFYEMMPQGDSFIFNKKKYYSPYQIENLYELLTGNTNYIIHPDEVLAENFVLAVLAQKDKSVLENLDEDGRALVETLLERLRLFD